MVFSSSYEGVVSLGITKELVISLLFYIFPVLSFIL
jgi:hypothetical protein